MKPISEFVVQMDVAETELKKTILSAFKAIDEAKVHFIEVYNEARLAMETDVAQREQSLRETVARAVEALNGDPEGDASDTSEASPKLPPAEPFGDAAEKARLAGETGT